MSGLIERVTGFRQLSDQKIHHVVVEKAQAVSQTWVEHVEETLSKASSSVINVDRDVDLYDPESREILMEVVLSRKAVIKSLDVVRRKKG